MKNTIDRKKTLTSKSCWWSFLKMSFTLICVILFHGVVGQSPRFTTSYAKKAVLGRIGHSVTFTWTFSGGVDTVTWGLANDKRFVSLDGRDVNLLPFVSVPNAYRGRVNGTRTVDSSSGQASFTLYDVTKDDERLYECWLEPNDPNFPGIHDFVQLVVVGMYLFIEL